jgi:hypothetical protein
MEPHSLHLFERMEALLGVRADNEIMAVPVSPPATVDNGVSVAPARRAANRRTTGMMTEESTATGE